jgi:hypothetical protein
MPSPPFRWLADMRMDLDDFRAALEWGPTKGNDAAIGGEIAALAGEGAAWTEDRAVEEALRQ